MRTYFVCPAPPCPNGKLHLGHIGGVYLLADIFVRFQRMAGHRAYYITGSDEHGTHTLEAARRLGRSFGEVAEQYVQQILECLRAVQITPDVFVRTSSAIHKENALAIFSELQVAGYVGVRPGVQLYCEHCSELVADSLATGRCPACSSPCDSNLCENCGLALQHDTIREARHASCGRDLVLRPIAQAMFDMPRLAGQLDEAIGESAWSEPIRSKARAWLRREVGGLPMTRHFKHGVEIKEPDSLAGQTLLTWFEGLWCFDTGIRELCARSGLDANATLHDENSELLFFMGQDNRFYYTLGVAGAQLARGYPIPKNNSVQDFYKLEGEKFSTSRDHALWADEVARAVGPNVLRYALARVAKPFGTDANHFDLDVLMSAASRIRVWEDALRRYAESAGTAESTELSPKCRRFADDYAAAVTALRFWDALDIIDRYFELVAFENAENGTWNSVQISLFLSLLYPVIPELAMGYGRNYFGEAWAPSLERSAVAAQPKASVDLPRFGAPIPASFALSTKKRFR
ncbi:class I tRNA ligase family protein [Bradyrhizobium sp. CB1717]|uniref:class I tRNA ligase family protein n=1 Tax=Bradyrhizobium sp. CB1717 TaxID=3039154 RepID=UPI0024B166F7|nr:class I tRNA ligase family protein [Bradyrhizobium sp. CB1717]WFU23221.1 class I tRNA ligase family protein [Bradyrhizobium sp. CB1717]